MSNTRNIFIPIEIISREFAGKLSIAAILKEYGHNPYIGYSMELIWNINRTNCDILILNNADYSDGLYKTLKRFTNSGGILCLLENEGAVFVNDFDILKRLDPRICGLIHTYFAWSENTANIVANASLGFKSIKVTGHPMFDAYHKSKEVKKISKRIDLKEDEFVLVNTNFALINEAVEGQYNNIGDYEYRSHLAVVKRELMLVIDKLVAELDIQIVLRPHPSESMTYYEERFRVNTNVQVIRDGPVVDWLTQCKMLIHNSCTTAIEAAILGKKIVSYQPILDDRYDLRIANDMGELCTSYEDVKHVLLNDSVVKEVDVRRLHSLKYLSAPLIAKEIQALSQGYEKITREFFYLNLKGLKETVKGYLWKTRLKFFFPERYFKECSYIESKFPSLNEAKFIKMSRDNDISAKFEAQSGFNKLWRIQ